MAGSKCTTLMAAIGGFVLGVVAGKLLSGRFAGCCSCCGRPGDDGCCYEEGQEDFCCCDETGESAPEEQAPAE
jgi:hypothetical protein